jgi:hypothetical protein
VNIGNEIKTAGSAQFMEVCRREQAGEFTILRLIVEKLNGHYTFVISRNPGYKRNPAQPHAHSPKP